VREQGSEWSVVTGAFGYTGKYITRRLLAMGHKVLTITGHPDRPNPFGHRVVAAPFNFNDPDELARTLRGATTVYNTYWVRFNHSGVTYDQAVENTRVLIKAAEAAGVKRFVHISITNASTDSPLPYFKGKGLLERDIRNSSLSYAIIRPTVIFGREDILINNIAWLLRRFPVFAIPGAGDYRLQPVFVEDLAGLAVEAAHQPDNMIIDAAGPEVYRFVELVEMIKDKIQSRAKIVHVRPGLAHLLSRAIGAMVKDVVLTGDEIKGLMANLLVSDHPPTGRTRLSEWIEQNSSTLGVHYASELNRHYRNPA
jgi:NADH dehydrogenase